jgi:hypothetical protein
VAVQVSAVYVSSYERSSLDRSSDMDSKRFACLLATVMIFAAAASRLVPHPWNCTPLIALALFAGARLDSPGWAVAATLGSLALGDLALGLFPYPGMAWVYLTAAAIVVLGRTLRRRAGLLAAILGGGFVFYAATNFGVWTAGQLYPRTWAGLASCYVAGLPFYRNQVAGDVFFTAVLFGLQWLGTSIHARYQVRATG